MHRNERGRLGFGQQELRRRTLADARWRVVVTLPHTRFAVTYYKLPNDPHSYLDVQSFPTQQDGDAGMTAEEFLAQAWELAHLRARELGWIV